MNLFELRRFFYELTALNPSEKRITIFLVIIIFLFIFLNSFHEKQNKSPIYFEDIDELKTEVKPELPSNFNDPVGYNEPSTTKFSKFNFNPNTASFDQLLQLGFDKRVASTILKYRSKGGKFKIPSDLLKIYGIDQVHFKTIEKFISIPEMEYKQEVSTAHFNSKDNENSDNHNSPNAIEKLESNPLKQEKISTTIEINSATHADFEKLFGIGPYLAKKIVNFRDKCGGFYSVDQVGETWGLPDSTFQSIRKNLVCEPSHIQKINLNTAAFEQLDLHPYITKALASDIINYRKKNGNFTQTQVLRSFQHIEDNYSKILPYLTF